MSNWWTSTKVCGMSLNDHAGHAMFVQKPRQFHFGKNLKIWQNLLCLPLLVVQGP